ncbi:cytochrome P450, partial [Nocardia brasiliensis]|uniref:cytochrome P450 n=1 Tax=Nocardia brasiliensis TaxID=37326 RepID=UPI0024560CF2
PRADRRAARRLGRLGRLREVFGAGPVFWVVPGRRVVVLLDPADVGRVLRDTPTPFHPANREKRAALRQFQPHGVLISDGQLREDRRTANEAALDTGQPLHHLAEPFTGFVAEAAAELRARALANGRLDAAQFTVEWWRLVRRLTLGQAARDDSRITDRLWRLRAAGNWSFLLPQRRALRDKFFDDLYRYAEIAEESSLLGALRQAPASGATDPLGQVPHWLFAFDAAGMALTRALALLAAHPEQHAAAFAQARERAGSAALPYLRACVLESVRLWPTTPLILRDTTEDTVWRSGNERFTVEKGAALLIAAVAFHRDESQLPFAHDFAPDIWVNGVAEQYPQLVPFSAGPAACPGRDLVLFVTSMLLAELVRTCTFELRSTPALDPGAPLPLTYNNFGIEFAVTPRRPTPVPG